VPPRWFLDALQEAGLRALISIPWAEHVQFLNDRKIRAQVVETIREGVSRHKGHPAIFGYLVGNEIRPRWCAGLACAASRNFSSN